MCRESRNFLLSLGELLGGFPLMKVQKITNFTPKAKAVKKKTTKKRASTYEPKVKFSGTFEDLIAISVTGAGAKNKVAKKK